jgi:hypothetical protein
MERSELSSAATAAPTMPQPMMATSNFTGTLVWMRGMSGGPIDR